MRRAAVAASSDVDEQSTACFSRAAATSWRRLRSVVAVDAIWSRGVVVAHPRGAKPIGACTCGRCAANHRRVRRQLSW